MESTIQGAVNHTYKQPHEWKTGAKIKHEDWDRGDKVAYQKKIFVAVRGQ